MFSDALSPISRSALIRLMVLIEISDDYENVDQLILPHVGEQAAKCGLAIKRSEIVDALAGLIQDGLAKAYLLSPFEPFSTELEGMPPLDVIEQDFETYFYVTKKGKLLPVPSLTTRDGPSTTSVNCDRTGISTPKRSALTFRGTVITM